jgi:hypothetical protein
MVRQASGLLMRMTAKLSGDFKIIFEKLSAAARLRRALCLLLFPKGV